MTYPMRLHQHDVELVTEIASRIYCTRLSLGDQRIDLAEIADDALAIYHSCVLCVKQDAG